MSCEVSLANIRARLAQAENELADYKRICGHRLDQGVSCTV